jgi:hypothetical protein
MRAKQLIAENNKEAQNGGMLRNKAINLQKW